MRELTLNPELCVDCGRCERNCPNNAIHVDDGIPLFCMHCDPKRAPCLLACPEGAIEEIGGAITISEDKCIGCGSCVLVCPIGAINIDEVGYAKKCNLCQGKEKQACVEACPTKALTNDSGELIHEKQEKASEKLVRLQQLMKH